MQHLKGLLAAIPKFQAQGSLDLMISGIGFDSRYIKKGNLFVAIEGINKDGHDFIEQAVNNGAVAVVGQRDIDPHNKFTYIKVNDARNILGNLASAWYGYPSNKLKVIGVTGTKGKTTTVHIIYHILSSLGEKVGLISSISAKIENKEIDTGFHVTNPDVISINNYLSEMVKKDCKYAVIEVSSHGIDQKRIAGINFEIGVLTNIAPEHLDYHHTFEKYKEVKMSFINSCKFKVISPKKTTLNILPGKFNNLNLEAALEVGEILGFGRDDCLKTIKSFKLPEGRLDEIVNNKGIRVFVDFAHTPDSLKAALTYLRTLTDKKVISVFGCAGERDPFKRPKMGRISSDMADITILTSEDPRSENAGDIISQIRKGMKSDSSVLEIPDREFAIKKALEIAQTGDVVGIFGKGHEKSMNLDGLNETPWSDRDIAEKYLN